MPNFEFREWSVGVIVGVLFCLALTPLAARGVRGLRPLAWFYALIMFLNGMGHTLFTILERTVESLRFPRPVPGFYSSPFLLIGFVWLIPELLRTARPRLSVAG